MSQGEKQGSGDGARDGRISSVPGLSKRLEKARVRVARTNLKKQLHDAAASAPPNADRITLTGGTAGGGDKRASERLEVSLPLQLRRAGSEQASDDRCRDLTPTGMFIATGEPLTLGSIVAFDCTYGLLRRFGGMARVVWTRQVTNKHGPRGVGVCFLDLDVTGVEALEFIMKHAAEHPEAVPTATVLPPGVHGGEGGRGPEVRSVTPTSDVIVDAELYAHAPPRMAAQSSMAAAVQVAGAVQLEQPRVPSPRDVSRHAEQLVAQPPAEATIQVTVPPPAEPSVVEAPTLQFKRPDLPGSKQPDDGESAFAELPPEPAQTPDSDVVVRAEPPANVTLEKSETGGGGYHVKDAETTVVRLSIPPDRETLRGRRETRRARPSTPPQSRATGVTTTAPPKVVGEASAPVSHDDDPLRRTLLGTPPRRDSAESSAAESPVRTAPAIEQPRTVVVAPAPIVEVAAQDARPRDAVSPPPPSGERPAVDRDGAASIGDAELVDSGEVEAYTPPREDDSGPVDPQVARGLQDADENDPVWRRARLAELVAKQDGRITDADGAGRDRTTPDELRAILSDAAFSERGRLVALGVGLALLLCAVAYLR